MLLIRRVNPFVANNDDDRLLPRYTRRLNPDARRRQLRTVAIDVANELCPPIASYIGAVKIAMRSCTSRRACPVMIPLTCASHLGT